MRGENLPSFFHKGLLNQHGQRAGDNQNQSDGRLFGEPLMKDKVGEGERHQDAQLVDGDNDAGKAVLQRAVIAQLGRAGGDAGQTDKAELVFGDLSDLPRLAGNKDHHPGHQQHHSGADGGAEVGLDAGDADFAQDGG